ncbi:InlB B-repeat-containing protein [Candidatus Methanomassiliicoccus intestinalis]|uniref:InlB B-repeat-containing protein n=1 Tax=Candidatus Methanomassiliicoccus intestinalis TaxID=1406512 RepID=UPI0037DCB8BD
MISISALLLLAFCLIAICPDAQPSAGGGEGYQHEALQNISNYELLGEDNSVDVIYHSNDSQNLECHISGSLYGTYLLIDKTPATLGWLDGDSSFIGWSLNPLGDKYLYSSGMMLDLDPNSLGIIPRSLDLYAIWNSYLLTVSFETFGGTSIAPREVNYRDVLTLPDDPERYNSTFIGWYADKEYGVLYSANDPVIENFTLYAKWYTYSVDYQVQYDGNYNTGGKVPITSYFESGDRFKVPGPGNLTKDGYTFAGWHYGDITYSEGAMFKMPSKSVHFVAVWEKMPECVVSFLVDDVQILSVNVESGQVVEVPDEPTKDGYKFSHWSLNDEEYDFTSAITGDLTLVAEWEKLADSTDDTQRNNQPDWFYTAIAIICSIVAILVYLLYKNKI